MTTTTKTSRGSKTRKRKKGGRSGSGAQKAKADAVRIDGLRKGDRFLRCRQDTCTVVSRERVWGLKAIDEDGIHRRIESEESGTWDIVPAWEMVVPVKATEKDAIASLGKAKGAGGVKNGAAGGQEPIQGGSGIHGVEAGEEVERITSKREKGWRFEVKSVNTREAAAVIQRGKIERVVDLCTPDYARVIDGGSPTPQPAATVTLTETDALDDKPSDSEPEGGTVDETESEAEQVLPREVVGDVMAASMGYRIVKIVSEGGDEEEPRNSITLTETDALDDKPSDSEPEGGTVDETESEAEQVPPREVAGNVMAASDVRTGRIVRLLDEYGGVATPEVARVIMHGSDGATFVRAVLPTWPAGHDPEVDIPVAIDQATEPMLPLAPEFQVEVVPLDELEYRTPGASLELRDIPMDSIVETGNGRMFRGISGSKGGRETVWLQKAPREGVGGDEVAGDTVVELVLCPWHPGYQDLKAKLVRSAEARDRRMDPQWSEGADPSRLDLAKVSELTTEHEFVQIDQQTGEVLDGLPHWRWSGCSSHTSRGAIYDVESLDGQTELSLPGDTIVKLVSDGEPIGKPLPTEIPVSDIQASMALDPELKHDRERLRAIEKLQTNRARLQQELDRLDERKRQIRADIRAIEQAMDDTINDRQLPLFDQRGMLVLEAEEGGGS